MQTTKRAIWPVFLALLLMTTATAACAEVYKWMDENGHAHYTEKPPKQGEHTQLHVQSALGNPQSESGNTRNLSSPMQDTHQQLLDDANARLQAARDLEAAKEKNRAEQRRVEDERAAAQKAIDDSRIAACKRNREVYCNNGVEGINKAEQKRNFDYEINQDRAFRGGY